MGGTGWTRDSGEAARACNVAAPRGDPAKGGARRSAELATKPLPLPQPGLGRQGVRGSRDAA